MLANFVLENFQQAVGSGDMFCRLAWIGAWFLVLGFHVTYPLIVF
jgi:hypothetical protein